MRSFRCKVSAVDVRWRVHAAHQRPAQCNRGPARRDGRRQASHQMLQVRTARTLKRASTHIAVVSAKHTNISG